LLASKHALWLEVATPKTLSTATAVPHRQGFLQSARPIEMQ
jgi:hypothetical protein